MSSARFPGKVMALLAGRPVIEHVISRVSSAIPLEDILVVTSSEPSDDTLAGYVNSLGVLVYRGPLDNVARRFQLALQDYPCDWFIRISADSPLIDSEIIREVKKYENDINLDLITNVLHRTFPKGHSVEMVSSRIFNGLDAEEMTPQQQEHVTKLFYDRPFEFQIINISSSDARLGKMNLCVDVAGDIAKLEQLLQEGKNISYLPRQLPEANT